MNYYINKGGRNYGPLSYDRIVQNVRTGRLEITDLVCPEGGAEWCILADLPEPQADVEQHKSNIMRSRELLEAVKGDIRPVKAKSKPKPSIKLTKRNMERLEAIANARGCTPSQAVSYLLDVHAKLSSLF